MGTYDPYGTNVYKGVAVEEDRGVDEETTMRKGEKVLFKKRKKAGSGSGSSNSNSNSNISNLNSVVAVEVEIMQDSAQRPNGNYARDNGDNDNDSGGRRTSNSDSNNNNNSSSVIVDYSQVRKIKTEPGILNPSMESTHTSIPTDGNNNNDNSIAQVMIKQEIKVEPKLESVKISFGLNGFKKMRKSSDDN